VELGYRNRPDLVLQHVPSGHWRHAREGLRSHRWHLLDQWPEGQIGQTNYAAAKAGIFGFTKALALESAARGITANAIAPGYIATDMVAAVSPEALARIVGQIPAGPLGQPDEIARLVQFLVSDAASFVTGSTIAANGGQYMT
jgi:acetoacetyl-CoA reductase